MLYKNNNLLHEEKKMMYKKYIKVFQKVVFFALILMLDVAQAQILLPENKETINPNAAEIIEKEDSTLQSILFPADKIDIITELKSACEKNKETGQGLDEDDFLKKLDNLSNSKQTQTKFTYPQFFLSSILYHSPKDWVVWINSEKFTNNNTTNLSDLKIVDINNEKVTLEWSPKQMSKISEVSDKEQKKLIKVDIINNKIAFSLKGNQTFSTYSMSIVEGKSPPITIDKK